MNTHNTDLQRWVILCEQNTKIHITCTNETQKYRYRYREMGNTVWGGVTWRRCGAVVSPSLQEYTRYNTVASHYRNTPWYTSRPSLQTDLSTVARNTLYYWQVRIMHCIMYIIGPPTGGKQGERIYIHPTGKGGCSGDKICWYWWNFSTLM